MLQTRIKDPLIRRGIIALALLAALPGTPWSRRNRHLTNPWRRMNAATMPQRCEGSAFTPSRVDAESQWNLGSHVPQRRGRASRTMPRPCGGTGKAAEQGVLPKPNGPSVVMYAERRGACSQDDAEAVRWFPQGRRAG